MRYRFVKDNDGHLYTIPADKLEDWNKFCDIPSDNEASWDVPKYAYQLGMHMSMYTFENLGH